MAVRGGMALAGAAAVAVILALVGAPAVDAQEDPAPAEPTAAVPSIRDALLGRSDDVSGSAMGGFGGGDTLDITLTLENHTADEIVVAVPRGALFETDDPSEQTAVTAGPADEDASLVKAGVDPTVTLAPGTNTVELTGFCAQHLDSGPNDVVPMSWAGMAEEPLPTVLTNIAAQQPSDEDAQHAVWWVTDVPVLPVPPEIEPLLEGVDTDSFAASPKRVVDDERYTPQWGRDQALDADDPFGESPFAESPFGGTDPGSGGNPFAVDDGSGHGGRNAGLFILGAVFACIVITVLVARSARRPLPAAAAARAGGTGPTPPGWYPDPQQPGASRYWDGRAWTSHTR